MESLTKHTSIKVIESGRWQTRRIDRLRNLSRSDTGLSRETAIDRPTFTGRHLCSFSVIVYIGNINNEEQWQQIDNKFNQQIRREADAVALFLNSFPSSVSPSRLRVLNASRPQFYVSRCSPSWAFFR